MLGGFTFKGIHSSVYGVRETPSNIVLSPLKRRNIIPIPGKSRAIVQQDGGYESRTQSMICSYAKQYGVDIHEQVRRIAGWLDGIGELTFDYEPTLHYSAFISTPPSVVTMLEFSQFEVQFTFNHPFAYETALEENYIIDAFDPLNQIELSVGGTVKTPVRITIKNNSETETITGIKVVHRYIENVEN
jgi:hypothetical protein